MSKECVDAILKIEKVENRVGFISSRRQVDSYGGYVNNWSTEQFHEYVREKNREVLLCRDHGGSLQGQQEDDGVDSFLEDLNYLDIIHIDPWKKYKSIEAGTQKTIDHIKLLHRKNSDMKFEVGTEEAIRHFSIDEMNYFLKSVKEGLTPEEYKSIVYCVVQSGVGLNLRKMKNTGEYSPKRLSKMIDVCKEYGVLSKEHNSDYLDINNLKSRFNEGLDAVNIAPELGQIQTQVYLENTSKDLFEEFFKQCLMSKKWIKWVDSSFDPYKNKKELILTCGHYVFAQDFVQNNFSCNDINNQVEENITLRVRSIIEALEGK